MTPQDRSISRTKWTKMERNTYASTQPVLTLKDSHRTSTKSSKRVSFILDRHWFIFSISIHLPPCEIILFWRGVAKCIYWLSLVAPLLDRNQHAQLSHSGADAQSLHVRHDVVQGYVELQEGTRRGLEERERVGTRLIRLWKETEEISIGRGNGGI